MPPPDIRIQLEPPQAPRLRQIIEAEGNVELFDDGVRLQVRALLAAYVNDRIRNAPAERSAQAASTPPQPLLLPDVEMDVGAGSVVLTFSIASRSMEHAASLEAALNELRVNGAPAASTALGVLVRSIGVPVVERGRLPPEPDPTYTITLWPGVSYSLALGGAHAIAPDELAYFVPTGTDCEALLLAAAAEGEVTGSANGSATTPAVRLLSRAAHGGRVSASGSVTVTLPVGSYELCLVQADGLVAKQRHVTARVVVDPPPPTSPPPSPPKPSPPPDGARLDEDGAQAGIGANGIDGTGGGSLPSWALAVVILVCVVVVAMAVYLFWAKSQREKLGKQVRGTKPGCVGHACQRGCLSRERSWPSPLPSHPECAHVN